MADQFRPYTAIVNKGSGCLIQPFSPDYTYVLTAKHNITNANGALILLQQCLPNGVNNWQMVDIPFSPLVAGDNYFPHPRYDIAIIRVDRLAGLDNIHRTNIFDEQEYYLTGYPEKRRLAKPGEPQSWFRSDTHLTILGSADGAKEAQIPGNPDQAEVAGQSGGPIIFERNGKLLLCGIEVGMAPAVEERLGHVMFYPLNAFDEIILQYQDRLSDILPFYMSCFSFLNSEIFELEAGFSAQNIAGVKGFLLHKAGEITRDECTPIAIKNFFNQRLLLDKQPAEVLSSKEIWCTWLEFLTIMNLIRTAPVAMDNVEDLFNSVRLLFSASDKDWSSELMNMIYSDYLGLKENGIVIIGMSRPPADKEYIIDKDKIPMIGDARNSRDRKRILINKGLTFPFDHFKFVHIDFFKGKSIVDKHSEWATLATDAQFLQKLKTEYDQLFRA